MIARPMSTARSETGRGASGAWAGAWAGTWLWRAFCSLMLEPVELCRHAGGPERLRMRQAIRLFGAANRGRKLTKGDLVTIEAEDILQSRVFDNGASRSDL